MRTKTDPSARTTLRPLTKDEIDRRIDGLIQTVASAADEDEASSGTELQPRWISAAELVRRMRPFVVLN